LVLSLGIAALIKQTAAKYLLITFLYFAYKKVGPSIIRQFLAGPLAMGVGLLTWLLVTKQFEWFFNWTFYYPATIWTQFPGHVDIALNARELMVVGTLLAIALYAANRRKSYLTFLFFWRVL